MSCSFGSACKEIALVERERVDNDLATICFDIEQYCLSCVCTQDLRMRKICSVYVVRMSNKLYFVLTYFVFLLEPTCEIPRSEDTLTCH